MMRATVRGGSWRAAALRFPHVASLGAPHDAMRLKCAQKRMSASDRADKDGAQESVLLPSSRREDETHCHFRRRGVVEVYQGPFQTAVRLTKILSVSSCGFTSVGAPLLACCEPSTTAYAVAALIMSFGLATTSALHFFIKPYVRVARFDYGDGGGASHSGSDDSDPALEIEQFSLFGRIRTSVIRASESSIPEHSIRPMTTMYAGGRAIFISFDQFEDKELLARFVQLPKEESVCDEEPNADANDNDEDGGARKESTSRRGAPQ
mmetsp:Transcript_10051/g.26853  ORF Transcript_10051/g.26853 Transcript_10051/m.26853 type:complete len:265 (+) Transcript_10051:1328-2122(+)